MSLKLGDYGQDVRDVQSILFNLGLLEKEESFYGIETKKAVMRMQEILGYYQSGEWNDQLLSMYAVKMSGGITPIARFRALAPFQEGDRVHIVGDNAVFGGLSSDKGKKIPKSQKGNKIHTVKRLSIDRQECLLNEIYSWVPWWFLDKVGDVTEQGITNKPSSIASAITTSTVSLQRRTGKIGTYNRDSIPCYVRNLITGTTTDFELVPEEVSDHNIANWEDQVTKSRPSPFKAYSSSGPRDVSFAVVISQDYCQKGILQVVRQLQALVVPGQGGAYVEAPRCLVRIGDIINMTAVCTDVGVEWQTPYKENVYHMATVSLAFNEVEDVAKFAGDWESV